MNDYLTTHEAATSLGVTRNRLMGWIYDQKVTAVKRGRSYFIHKDEVERKRVELAA